MRSPQGLVESMRSPGERVGDCKIQALTDGESYVVRDFLYHQHLAVAVEIKQVSLMAVSLGGVGNCCAWHVRVP